MQKIVISVNLIKEQGSYTGSETISQTTWNSFKNYL